jgi:hypothetical protein
MDTSLAYVNAIRHQTFAATKITKTEKNKSIATTTISDRYLQE